MAGIKVMSGERSEVRVSRCLYVMDHMAGAVVVLQ
jgi:hypothetical protein